MNFAGVLAITLSALGQEYVVEGQPASAVRVIAYEDLQCSDCAIYRRMLDEKLLPAYGQTVAFEHREFPLSKHALARPAAIAARYFGSMKPEVGIAFRRYCAANLSNITPDNFEAKLRAFASANWADPTKTIVA